MMKSDGRPEVGRRYRVEFADCCARGSFTATLVSMDELDYDDKPAHAGTYTVETLWDNGLRLEAAFRYYEMPS